MYILPKLYVYLMFLGSNVLVLEIGLLVGVFITWVMIVIDQEIRIQCLGV